MSTRTIALDSQVYDRLAAVKREDESFSRAIERLIERGIAHTGNSILQRLANMSPLSEEDSKIFMDAIAENRASEEWKRRDLR